MKKEGSGKEIIKFSYLYFLIAMKSNFIHIHSKKPSLPFLSLPFESILIDDMKIRYEVFTRNPLSD